MRSTQIYHKFPTSFRSFAASVWGYYLRWWRYGSETEAMVEECLSRDNWSDDKWQSWQEERLACILHRAATTVPFYRSIWNERRKKGDKTSWEILENWPILTKELLRSNDPRSFLTSDQNPKYLYAEHTSGTTGTPLTIYNSRKTLQKWYSIYEARIRRWNEVSRNDRWGIIGGQLVVPQTQVKTPFWVWNQGLNQLYLSAYHISSNTTQNYIEAIKKYELVYLLSYPSSLYSIAQDALTKKIIPPSLKVIISNAEPLYSWQKETIENFFQCPVRNTYGMSEIVIAASECSAGKLHLMPDVGITEVLEFETDEPVKPWETGRLICTGLLNQDMPLIRYEVGDTGAINNSVKTCSCSRNLPIITNIEGRIDDLIITPAGRHIGRLDPVFKADFQIKEAQIVQEEIDVLKVYVVPSTGFNKKEKNRIQNSIQQYVGNEMSVFICTVNEISRTKSGKFKAVVSKLKNDLPK
jgi:phenylacetate-CoA ligase